MTIKERLVQYLEDGGFFLDEAVACVDEHIVSEDAHDDCMKDRWNDDVEGYPPALLVGLVIPLRESALRYIDRVCPRAWYRQSFVDPE